MIHSSAAVNEVLGALEALSDEDASRARSLPSEGHL